MDKQNQKLLNSSPNPSQNHGQEKASTTTTTTSAAPATSIKSSSFAAKDNADSIDRIKLNYVPVRWSQEALQQWSRILKQDPTKKVQFVEVVRLVRMGVPMKLRGEVWMFLMNQYQLRYGASFQPVGSDFIGDANQTYRGLLSQLSTQQHEIFVDIGKYFMTLV
jgi:hypothetical protein